MTDKQKELVKEQVYSIKNYTKVLNTLVEGLVDILGESEEELNAEKVAMLDKIVDFGYSNSKQLDIYGDGQNYDCLFAEPLQDFIDKLKTELTNPKQDAEDTK